MASMSSRERLKAVLNKEIPDRVPISPRIWRWLLERYGNANFETYLKLKELFDYDPIIIVGSNIQDGVTNQYYDFSNNKDLKVVVKEEMKSGDPKIYTTRTIETPSGKLRDIIVHPPSKKEYGISPNPYCIEPLIKTEDDISRLKYLLFDNFPYIDYTKFKKEIGNEGLIAVRPHSGVDHMFVETLGLTNALMLYYDNKELFVRLLDLYHKYYKKMLIHTLEQGVEIIFEAWFNTSLSAGWSPNIYRECFLPCIIEDAEIVHSYGAYFYFYDDGKIMPLINDFKKVDIDIFCTLTPPPAGDADAKIIKSVLGKDTVLNGYIDTVNIRFGKPNDIMEQVEYAIKTLGDGGGYILGTSDSITEGSPFENVKAFFDAGRRFGSYK